MQDLIKQEIFELEVLDNLNSYRLLDKLIFTGGTMLRLCHGLDRYSIDLDFWIIQPDDFKKMYDSIQNCLLKFYKLKDSANKHYTLLFEIKSDNYPNRLKIEIRKEKKKIKYEKTIAYSENSNKQVLLNAVSLSYMMKAKIDALINRREIRDAFDIEFLIKKGVGLNLNEEQKKQILFVIQSFTKRDYTVKLGSILDSKIRKYYITENFKIFLSKLQ